MHFTFSFFFVIFVTTSILIVMIFSVNFVRFFAWISIITSIFHTIGEGYFIYKYGQPFLQTLVDVIAVSLLFFGGKVTLKNNNSLGVLCGAWGFTFCLNYRAWVWRYYAKIEGVADANTDTVGTILFFLLIFSCVCFILSVLINLPKTKIV